jgi:hypothetical protein
MKNAFVFFTAALFLLSCDEDTKPVNADSLAADSALKAQQSITVPKTERSDDTLHMVALPPVFEGDLVFQNRDDEQLLLFGKAMKSKYNNVGIIFMHWNDEGMYPSEFVWKVYNRGPKLDICTPRTFSDLDLSDPKVAEVMKTKYGNKLPKDEPVVTPDDLYNSPKMEVIFEK